MLGSFLSRTLLLVFGYAYPGYECFKIVEHNKSNNKPENVENLLIWCQYWILVAMITVSERIGDVFFSWLPLYSEAKLGFLIYLWSSKMKGTRCIYRRFVQPFMVQHEEEIDRNINEIRGKAGSFIILYWKKALVIGQTKFFQIFQIVSSLESFQSQPTHYHHQGKEKRVSTRKVDSEEDCDTEIDQNQEEIMSPQENEDTKSLQHKAVDKETTLLMQQGQGQWRK